MNNVFTYHSIIPAFQNNTSVVRWEVIDSLKDGNFIIQKSPNGVTGWTTLNGSGDIGISEFIDKDFDSRNLSSRQSYRLILLKDGKRYDSPSFTVSDLYTIGEFKMARAMIGRENIRMTHNGVPCLIYKLKKYGEPCDCIDPNSGIAIGKGKCEICFGTGIVGGFYEPSEMCVEFMQTQHTKSNNQNGIGINEQIFVQAICLSYPKLEFGDMIIRKQTNDRYVVNNSMENRFKDIIPINTQLTLERLPNNDIRYRV